MRFPDGKKIALYTSVAAQVRRHREGAGLTKAACARELGIALQTLNGFEEARGSIPLHFLVAFADLVDCTLDDLVPVQS